MDKLKYTYAAYSKALPPQPTKIKPGGWAGENQKMADGSEPQPWHCLPFVEAATYGLELIYPFDNECNVINENGTLRFDWDFANEAGGEVTGGEFIAFAPKHASKYYLFNTRLDIVPPEGHVIRTEPHPRFFTDDTGTVPISLVGHVQNEWWPRRFFVVFKSPPIGGRHVFRKGEPYAQILFVPNRFGYEGEAMGGEEEKRRRGLEAAIDAAKSEISENVWHNPAGTTFSDHYKILARAYGKDGLEGVEAVVRAAGERRKQALPADRSIAEALAQGAQKVNERKYEEARAIYAHVLERDPRNPEALSQMGIVVACIGRPLVGLQMMEQATALAPHVHTFQSNLGELLRLLGRLPEAEAAFRTSLKINPNDAGTMSVLGLTLAQQGRAAEGLEHCRLAAEKNATSAPVRYRLGLVLALAGRPEEARAAYESALALEPRFVQAQRGIEALPGVPGR